MSERMEMDEYPRDRSRSPGRRNDYGDADGRRERSRSPRRDGERNDRYFRGDRGRGRGGRGRGRGRGSDRSYYSSYRGAPRRGGYGGDYQPPSYDQYSRPGYDQRSAEYEIKANRKYENSIFVGNIPYNCQWYQLKDHFAPAGEIVRADIVTNHGKSRGMGTIEFADRETAQKAIQMFDRTPFAGRDIFVREDLPPPEKKDTYGGDRYGGYEGDRYPPRHESRYERPSRDTYRPNAREAHYHQPSARGEPAKGYEVFVGNLPFSVKWQDLKDLFREFGEIERADIIETSYGKSKGMGTVHYYNESDAQRAIEKMNGFDWFGRRIEVRQSKFLRPGEASESSAPSIRTDGLSKNTDFTLGVTGDGEPSAVIFVGNLPWETSESDLHELFGSVASVKRAELQYGRGGNPAGNAVVEFEDEETAVGVISQLNGYDYGNRTLRVSFARYPTQEKLEELRGESGLSFKTEHTESTETSNFDPAPVVNESHVESENIAVDPPTDAPPHDLVDEPAAAPADVEEEMIEE